MIEPTEASDSVPLSSSRPEPTVPLESILCTEPLQSRPSRPPDYEKENRALVKLVSAMADSPSTIFQTLAETIQDITQCDSSGLSLLTKDGKSPHVDGQRFYWPAICGMWNPHVGGGTPRNFGPCGDVLDQNRTLLFTHFERRYPYLMPVSPAAEECLLVPFYVDGKAVGTIWGIMHTNRRRFDAEDDRVMASLGKFASSAYQAWMHIEDLRIQVAEREKAEAQLRELNDGLEKQVGVRTEELSAMVETIPGLVWCAAPDGELNYLNQRIMDYTGTRADAWRQARWTNFLHEDDVEPTVTAWSNAVATGRSYYNECRLRRSDGIYRWFQVVGQAARDNKGGVTRWYGLLIDIDDRKNMEDALRANERDLRLIVDTIPALVCTMTSRGKVESVNQQAIDYCGYAPTDSSAIHPDDIDRVNARWRHSVETGEPHDVDLRLRRFDGVYRWFHVRGLPLRDAERHILRWYILLTDMEDRRRAEEALRSSETRLARATRTATLGEFAASVAHEINQPLAAVVANGNACLRWLSAQPPGLSKAQEAAERIVRDGTEAGEVVRRIRALFKHASLETTVLNLNEVVAEVLHLLNSEAAKRRVGVETELADNLPAVTGDRVQLQQLLFNLLLNGIEAMDSILDRPKKLSIRTALENHDTALVKIQDSGVGLPDPEKVFEAFFTTKESGMGMGLAICRSIVDAHHGRLWAESSEGSGTTFFLTLPVESKSVL